MKPRSRTINLKLKNEKDRITFLERMEDVEGTEFSISSRDSMVRIRIYGTKDQISDFTALIKSIQKELTGEEHAIEDIERK